MIRAYRGTVHVVCCPGDSCQIVLFGMAGDDWSTWRGGIPQGTLIPEADYLPQAIFKEWWGTSGQKTDWIVWKCLKIKVFQHPEMKWQSSVSLNRIYVMYAAYIRRQIYSLLLPNYWLPSCFTYCSKPMRSRLVLLRSRMYWLYLCSPPNVRTPLYLFQVNNCYAPWNWDSLRFVRQGCSLLKKGVPGKLTEILKVLYANTSGKLRATQPPLSIVPF